MREAGVIIIPVVEGEVIVVLDWPEDLFIESGLVAPYI
jgi:hypothetical protein